MIQRNSGSFNYLSILYCIIATRQSNPALHARAYCFVGTCSCGIPSPCDYIVTISSSRHAFNLIDVFADLTYLRHCPYRHRRYSLFISLDTSLLTRSRAYSTHWYGIEDIEATIHVWMRAVRMRWNRLVELEKFCKFNNHMMFYHSCSFLSIPDRRFLMYTHPCCMHFPGVIGLC